MLLVLSAVFTVIGFGLLLAHFNKSTFLAITASLFTVSLTAILSPILSKFWFNIFLGDFTGSASTPANPARLAYFSFGGTPVFLDFYNLKVAMANSIAQLVALLALYGRLNPAQLFFNSIGFNFAWNLNHFLCCFLTTASPDPRLFDDYQISNVYLFAAAYGLVASSLISSPLTAISQFRTSKNSEVLAHLGTFFLFLAFAATSTLYPLKFSKGSSEFERTYFWQEGLISVFLALSASVISNYAFSALLSRSGKLTVRGSLLGTITGAIMYGSVAATSINIGAAIAVGLLAGFFSALYYEKLYVRVNETNVRDSFGYLNILAVSFVGTFIVAPTTLKTYYNYAVSLTTLQASKIATGYISNLDIAGWVLAYVGISIAIGLASGLIGGLVLRCLQRKSVRFLEDGEMLRVSSFGLRLPEADKAAPELVAPSAQELYR